MSFFTQPVRMRKHTIGGVRVSEDREDRWEGREGRERDALYALVPGEDQDYMTIFGVDELAREIDHADDPMSVLRPLINAGLVNTLENERYVFATRAGVKAVAMIGKVV